MLLATLLARMDLLTQQASNARLEIAILGGIDERVDTAVHEHQHYGKMVEPGCVVDSAAEDADNGVDLIG